jgi:hypothetical protein
LRYYGGTNRIDTCYDSSNPEEFGGSSDESRLKKLGLINFEKEVWYQDGKRCEAGSRTTYTPLYDEVRRYLIDVLSTMTFDIHKSLMRK